LANPASAQDPNQARQALFDRLPPQTRKAALQNGLGKIYEQSPPAAAGSPLSFSAKATGYHPTSDDDKMEGGPMGAAEWHGVKLKQQEPLYTLDEFREGAAPYVSVAMDNTKTNPLKYGTMLKSPQFPGVPFRVMDTGSAFNGTGSYGPARGLKAIDIARRDKNGADSSENNRVIQFQAL
jgi:hypothetical protein